ncbi:MAG: chemotaxis protein methyltransferase CheR [Phenylobacterium sp.]|jgi:chemotaxis protein methyltransferase CheR
MNDTFYPMEQSVLTRVKEISDWAFGKIQSLIFDCAGINMSDAKKNLVVGRLSQRLRVLELKDFDSYYRYLTSPASQGSGEMQCFIDLLTTNETYFFREQPHFDFLQNTVLPAYMNGAKRGRKLSIWSAASSSGEEGYSLGMLLAEKLGMQGNWSVYGSDISSEMLNKAREAVYNLHRIRLVPQPLCKKYLRKGVGKMDGKAAVRSALKKHVTFGAFNLIEGPLDNTQYDVIFCRNVLIYFDTKTKEKVISRLVQRLAPGGYLITGHTESIHDLRHDLNTVTPSIHQKQFT